MKQLAFAALASALIASAGSATGHEIPWSNGAPRIKGYGHCAKGPCQRRAAFESSVPHRHLGNGKCGGLGAAGYTFGHSFTCAR
jgi:hypothetical protein